MNKTKEIDMANLPENVRRELIDFYEYLLNKYSISKTPGASGEPDILKKKRLFFASIKKHSFNIPKNFKFNRDELHDR